MSSSRVKVVLVRYFARIARLGGCAKRPKRGCNVEKGTSSASYLKFDVDCGTTSATFQFGDTFLASWCLPGNVAARQIGTARIVRVPVRMFAFLF